ncbi:enoyl-CoA hydratase-related protein [Dactylosporangium sp. CA-233914]|uniref:enoyl-CoA hydratase-related protein n=1 Tax=Dactylosporangium sp. CA-233914 TaxID=3239934 RepID=UPI003D8BAFBA
MGNEQRVSVERRGPVLIIRMCRESKRNAVDPLMTAALDEALNHLDDDVDLWCGVLVGGEGAFSAGTDLASGAGDPTERGGPYGLIKRRRRTPLIAAVEGIAFGGGFELVMSCDMVVAGRSARFGLPEVARGVIPTCGGLFRTWQSLPLMVAKQLVLTGKPLTARRAYELGLVNEIVDDGEAQNGAIELAERVCENSPFAVSASLTAMNDVIATAEDVGWLRTDQALDSILASEDHQEGVAAFLEKRSPRWRGR